MLRYENIISFNERDLLLKSLVVRKDYNQSEQVEHQKNYVCFNLTLITMVRERGCSAL